MIKFAKSFFLFFLIFHECCIAQHIKPEALFGKWKVQNWLFFENIKETQYEYKERMKDYHKCLNAEVIIDSEGIKIRGNNICYFEPCHYNFARNPKYLEKKIIQDNDYTKQEQGSEMIDSNVVGREFVKYLDKHYSKPKLLLIDAGCTQSYGNFTMKICVANKNKIGLFMGEEMIILERKIKKKKK